MLSISSLVFTVCLEDICWILHVLNMYLNTNSCLDVGHFSSFSSQPCLAYEVCNIEEKDISSAMHY